jgi:hypothetical protein
LRKVRGGSTAFLSRSAYPKDGSGSFLSNARKQLPKYTALYPKNSTPHGHHRVKLKSYRIQLSCFPSLKSCLFSLPSSPEAPTEEALTCYVTCRLEVSIFTNNEIGHIWRRSPLAKQRKLTFGLAHNYFSQPGICDK